MKLFVVSYDLRKTDKDYSSLFEEMKNCKAWWHYLKSTWLIYTNETASEIFKRLHPHLDKIDNLLIIEAGKERQGWLPKEAWTWIRDALE